MLADEPAPVGSSATLYQTYDGEELLMRPVLAGLCKYESLTNGTMDLDDFDRLNHALDVQAANTRIMERVAQDGRRLK